MSDVSARPSRRRRAIVLATTGVAAFTLCLTFSREPPPGGQAQAPSGSALDTASPRPWSNTRLDPSARAGLLLAQMDTTEKVDLMTGDPGSTYAYYNASIDRLGVPALKMADGGGGIAPRGWSLPGTGEAATALPAEIALGATWSVAAADTYAGLVADEARATGHNVLLGPDSDIVRNPWTGRVGESTGEDPMLTAALTTAYVTAVQARQVMATMKHFVAYTQETGRSTGHDVTIDDRTLNEVDTISFASAIAKAGLSAVMCSYNKINGEYSCQRSGSGMDLLRKGLGFAGFVLTDYGALHDTRSGLLAGTDMETGEVKAYGGALSAALSSGGKTADKVDGAVLRILTTMFRLGLFDTSYRPSPIPVVDHDAVARSIENKAITLLKNDDVLPLETNSSGSIALIGADADTIAAAGGSSYVLPTATTSVLQGIRRRAAGRVTWVSGNDAVNGASMIEAADRTTVPSSVLSPPSGVGTGLDARYWRTPDFRGEPTAKGTVSQVAYDTGFISTFALWGRGGTKVPAPPVTSALEQQSMTLDGVLTAPSTGEYVLSLTGWGDVSMALDGQNVMAMSKRSGRWVTETRPLNLKAGSRHRLHISYAATHPLSTLQPGTLLLQWRPPVDGRSPAMVEAVSAAEAADVAIVYVRTFESEERDRVSLKLPQSADQLIEAVAAVNPRTVVVLSSAGPVTMPWIDKVSAVVQMYFGGQAQGASLADVLFGDVNPSGRLPLTYPVNESDVPLPNPWAGEEEVDDVAHGGLDVGYKSYERRDVNPLFPFGYGLSYTTFAFERTARPTVVVDGRTLRVSLRVVNTGQKAGAATVQVYARPLDVPGAWTRRLIGFAQVSVPGGATKEVDLPIELDSPTHPLGRYDADQRAWVTEAGDYSVEIGASSRDTFLRDLVHLD